MGVTIGSSDRAQGFAASSLMFRSEPQRMVRNLSVVNFIPLVETRVCRYNTGPGEETFTKIAIRRIKGARRTSEKKENTISAKRTIDLFKRITILSD